MYQNQYLHKTMVDDIKECIFLYLTEHYIKGLN